MRSLCWVMANGGISHSHRNGLAYRILREKRASYTLKYGTIQIKYNNRHYVYAINIVVNVTNVLLGNETVMYTLNSCQCSVHIIASCIGNCGN